MSAQDDQDGMSWWMDPIAGGVREALPRVDEDLLAFLDSDEFEEAVSAVQEAEKVAKAQIVPPGSPPPTQPTQ